MKKNRSLLLVGVIAAVLIIAVPILLQKTREKSMGISSAGNEPIKVTVMRSPTCGCCANYVAYLKKKGFDVVTKFIDDAESRLTENNVPPELGSCHTTLVGNYAVEGHVPVEAIQKLLQEKPSLAGIALPAMPSGSPGMPGRKIGSFDIYGFNFDGSSSLFVSQ